MRNSDYLNRLSDLRRERDHAMRMLRQVAQLSGKYRERGYQGPHPELLAMVDDIDDLLSIDWRGNRGGDDA